MSRIINFLIGDESDDVDRLVHDYIDMDDAEWESDHRMIQWAFPLPEPSGAQPGSPIATQDDYNTISIHPVLKGRLLMLLGRYIAFLDRTYNWRRAKDHNHLRITRVLRCLTLSGLGDVAVEFHGYVTTITQGDIGKETLHYWSEALKRHPAWLPNTKPVAHTINGKVLADVTQDELIKYVAKHRDHYIRSFDGGVDEGRRAYECLVVIVEDGTVTAKDLPDYGMSDQWHAKIGG